MEELGLRLSESSPPELPSPRDAPESAAAINFPKCPVRVLTFSFPPIPAWPGRAGGDFPCAKVNYKPVE
jgi:hypothetical protein